MQSSYRQQLNEAIAGHHLARLQELTTAPTAHARCVLGEHLTELVEAAGAAGNLEGLHHLLSQVRSDERFSLTLAA